MLGTALLAGTDLDGRDAPGAPLVAIVNEAFAERFLKTKQPIGRTFKLQVSPGDPDPAYQIVGVVQNTKYANLREALGPVAYFPEAQLTDPDPVLTQVMVLVRSRLPLSTLTASMTAAGRDVSPAMLVGYRTLGGGIRQSFLRERLMATLSAFFGPLAVWLEVCWLVTGRACMVARRRNGGGHRMA